MRSARWTILAAGATATALGLSASAQQQAPPPARPQAARLQANRAVLAAQAQPVRPPAQANPPPSTQPGGASVPSGPAGSSQPLPIDWAAANRGALQRTNLGARIVTGRFVAANRPAIDAMRLPVLLPGDPDLAANLRFFGEGDYYTLSSTTVGMAFQMTGAARAYALPPVTARGLRGDLRSRIPTDGIVIEQSEVGLDASVNRFGGVYSVSLECASAIDPRCTDPTYLRGVISRLTVVVPKGH